MALALTALSAALAVAFDEQGEPSAARIHEVELSPVSVRRVAPGEHAGWIEAFAEVRPRWSATIKAHVRGAVTAVAARAGMQVASGERLVEIADHGYRARLAEARQGVAEARLHLVEEQTRVRAGAAEGNPRLAVAESGLSGAEARLEEARANLRHTRVDAPFSGFVTRRLVSPGETVEAGDPLVELIGDRHLTLEVSLAPEQFAGLAEGWREGRARVESAGPERTLLGEAAMVRGGGFLDPATRRHRLFLELAEESAALPGAFVRVALPGRLHRDALRIPEGALSKSGHVWFLDEGDRLRRFEAEVRVHLPGEVVIARPAAASDGAALPAEPRIVLTPLASFVVGARVAPREG